MAIDVQQDGLWYGIRAFDGEGGSKLLNEGLVHTFEQAKQIEERYKVKSTCVFVDCAWDTPTVLEACSKNKWIGINGRDRQTWLHDNVEKLYSEPKVYDTPHGKAFYYLYSGEHLKDILANLRAGRGVAHEIPDDVSGSYKRQMQSEIKKDKFNKKTGKSERGWCQIRADNHLWDVEVMLVAAAQIHGLL